MKKKIFIAMLALATVTVFIACNNASTENKEAEKEKMHDGDNHKKDDGHQHDTTHKNDADTLGMKMGGNELDSKKK